MWAAGPLLQKLCSVRMGKKKGENFDTSMFVLSGVKKWGRRTRVSRLLAVNLLCRHPNEFAIAANENRRKKKQSRKKSSRTLNSRALANGHGTIGCPAWSR